VRRTRLSTRENNIWFAENKTSGLATQPG